LEFCRQLFVCGVKEAPVFRGTRGDKVPGLA
jgi:hypothetical protein